MADLFPFLASWLAISSRPRVGRRPMFLAGTVLMFIFFGVCGLAPSPTVFSVMMFFSGASNLINYATAFVLGGAVEDKFTCVYSNLECVVLTVYSYL